MGEKSLKLKAFSTK